MFVLRYLFFLSFFVFLIKSGFSSDDIPDVATPIKRLFSAVDIRSTQTGLPVSCSVKQKQGFVHISGTMIFHVADAMAQLAALQESPLLMQKPDSQLQLYFLKNGIDHANRIKINGDQHKIITYYHVTANDPIAVGGCINTTHGEEVVIVWPANTILENLTYDQRKVAVYSLDQIPIYNAAIQALAGIGLLDRGDEELSSDIKRITQQAELLIKSAIPSSDARADFDRITMGTAWLCEHPFMVRHLPCLQASTIHLCGSSIDQMYELKERFPNFKANLVTHINHPRAPCGLYAKEDITCIPGFEIAAPSDLIAIWPLDAPGYSFVVTVKDGMFFILENHRGVKVGHLALKAPMKKGSMLDAVSKGVLSPALVLALMQELAKRAKSKQKDSQPKD